MKDIPGYPGYKLSDDLQNIIGKKGKPLSLNGTSHKYGNVYVDKKTSLLYLHRAIALVHVPGYFDGAWVDHVDDNPYNNDPSNLKWVTPRENNFLLKITEYAHLLPDKMILELIEKYEVKIQNLREILKNR
jgi:hypothetical protein